MARDFAKIKSGTYLWWSPESPATYVLGTLVGLGYVAHHDYAAFNVAWASYDLDAIQLRDELMERQVKALAMFNRQRPLNKALVHNIPLGSWLTILNQVEFRAWAKENQAFLEPAALENMRLLLNGERE